MADMREGLRSSLQAERDARSDQAAGEQVMRKLTSRLDVALPDDLLRAQFEQSALGHARSAFRAGHVA